MGGGVLDPILEQREGISGKAGGIWRKVGAELTAITIGRSVSLKMSGGDQELYLSFLSVLSIIMQLLKVDFMVLDRWLFQKTCAQFPAPTSWSTVICNSSRRGSDPLFWPPQASEMHVVNNQRETRQP